MANTQDNAPAVPSQNPTPTPTPTVFPVPKDGHVVALTVTLLLIGILLVVGITLFTMRMRRARSEQQQGSEVKNAIISTRKSTILDLRHPASHITPFGTHRPGTNMRIARRRLDGAWDFEDPEAPFNPDGVTDLSPLPLSPSPSNRWTVRSKVAEVKMERDRRRDTDSSTLRGVELPPPAYHPEQHPDEGCTNRKD